MGNIEDSNYYTPQIPESKQDPLGSDMGLFI
jgi:hypothetical protein